MGLRGPLPRHSPKPSATTSPPLPPPAWLPPPAVEVWQEIEPRLRAAGRLRQEHAEALAAWACTAAELRELSVVIARDGSTAAGPHGTHPSAAHSAATRLRGTLLQLGKALGLDPVSSARMEAVGGPADDGHDAVREYAASRDRPRQSAEATPPPVADGPLTIIDYIKRHRDTA